MLRLLRAIWHLFQEHCTSPMPVYSGEISLSRYNDHVEDPSQRLPASSAGQHRPMHTLLAPQYSNPAFFSSHSSSVPSASALSCHAMACNNARVPALQAATRWRCWWATTSISGTGFRLPTGARTLCSRMLTRWTATQSAASRAQHAL